MTAPVAVAILVLTSLCVVATQGIVDGRSADGLAYDFEGEGRVVVMIHGTNLDRRMWQTDAEWLREETRVLRYDLRGQGSSEFPTDVYSNHSDLIGLLEELGVQEAVLLGLSAGAQVALDVALEMPAVVTELVLVSPSIAGYLPSEMPGFMADLTTALRAGDLDQANEVLIGSSIMAVPAESAAGIREMVEDNDRLWTIPYSLVRQPSRPDLDHLEEVTMPTLILVGQNDEAAIHEQGVLLERGIPNARRVTIQNGGHLLNLTSPTAFHEALSEFLGVSPD